MRKDVRCLRGKRSKRNCEAGLTLIEVLIVVFIISVILAIVIPNYAESTKRAQVKLCHANQRMVESQIMFYEFDTGKSLSSTVTNANIGSEIYAHLVNGGYIKEHPQCPADGNYELQVGKLHCSKHDHYSDQETDG